MVQGYPQKNSGSSGGWCSLGFSPRIPFRLLLQWKTRSRRTVLPRMQADGDIYIVMSKDWRIVRLFAYDHRSYSLFEKKFVSGYQFMRIIKDSEGNEVAYRIDWKDVVLLLENPVIKSLNIR